MDGKHMEWTTPVGFVVRQRYFKRKPKRIDVPYWDKKEKCVKTRKFVIRVTTKNIDKGRVNRAVVANFIHSMDAAAMYETANIFLKNQQNLAVIHDCFGAPAGDIALLEHHARIGLYYTHAGGEMWRYHSYFEKELDDNLHKPLQGKFDIQRVLKAFEAYI